MAKCKDCSTEVGFLKKRCEACDQKYKELVSEQKEQAAFQAAEKSKADSHEREKRKIEQAKANLNKSWDKFEQKGEISGPTFKPSYADAKFQFSCINNKTWWLTATHSQDDWEWLDNNRTIILFDDDSRFIQEHTDLRGSDVYTNWSDDVKCYEEHHIDITDAVPSFVEFYETNKWSDENATVPIKIGRNEYRIELKHIRTIAAMASAIEES
jgi:hypothetical protein